MIAMCGSAIRSAFLWNGRPKSPWEPLYRFTPSVRKTGMSKAWRSSRHRPPDEQTFLSDAAAGRGSIPQATTLLRGRRLSLSSFASVLASLTVRLKPESRHDGTAFWPASAPEDRARLSGACGSTSCRSASGPSRGHSESTPPLGCIPCRVQLDRARSIAAAQDERAIKRLCHVHGRGIRNA